MAEEGKERKQSRISWKKRTTGMRRDEEADGEGNNYNSGDVFE